MKKNLFSTIALIKISPKNEVAIALWKTFCIGNEIDFIRQFNL